MRTSHALIAALVLAVILLPRGKTLAQDADGDGPFPTEGADCPFLFLP